MKTQDQFRLAREHARQIAQDINTHKNLADRVRLHSEYYFEAQTQYESARLALRLQQLRTQPAQPKSVPAERPKFSVIRGGK